MWCNITHSCFRTPLNTPVLLFNVFGVRLFFFHVKVILVEVGHSFYLVYVLGLCIHTLFPNRESPKGPAPKRVKGTWMGEKGRHREQQIWSRKCLEKEENCMV